MRLHRRVLPPPFGSRPASACLPTDLAPQCFSLCVDVPTPLPPAGWLVCPCQLAAHPRAAMQRFLPLLPDGETGDGGETLDLIAEDVEGLLASDAASLWAVARDDPSLLLLIASFLQYAK